MARSAKLRRCECSGTNWYCMLFLSKPSIRVLDFLLSKTQTSGATPTVFNLLCRIYHASMRAVAVLFLQVATGCNLHRNGILPGYTHFPDQICTEICL